MKRKVREKPKNQIDTEKLLELIKAGAALFIAFTAPGALKLFEGSFKDPRWGEYYPSSIERSTYKLWRKGYVDIQKNDGKTTVKLTEKGKVETLKFSLKDLKINKPIMWDGKWRLVMFDIPKGKNGSREILRDKLYEMGFFLMQKSVFVYPYPCEKEIKFLREVLEVPHGVKLIRADRIEDDEDLRKIFSL